jgi:peptidoglycan/LPS O-acetylase OafA/YrhL
MIDFTGGPIRGRRLAKPPRVEHTQTVRRDTGEAPGLSGDSVVTLAAGFAQRRNSLNFLRLMFALVVIVSHTWPIGGYGDDPRIAGEKLGTWAVAGFFAISGYLIANSRLHGAMSTFLARRVLRIYPGYLVCLVVVAFAFAPVSAAIDPGSIRWPSAFSYVFDNLLLKVHQDGISGTLTRVPYGPAWNGSLWTLIYEFGCYLAIGVLLSVAAGRHRSVVVAAFVATAGLYVVERHLGHGESMLGVIAFLGAVFFAGSAMAVFADRVPLDWRIGILAIGIAAASAELGAIPWLGALPIAYVCMWLGAVLPFHKVGRLNDFSYGVYIYAFPVQQMIMVVLGRHRLPVGVTVILSVVFTLPFAVASWFVVEKKALALKDRLGASPRPVKPAARHRATTRLASVETQ